MKITGIICEYNPFHSGHKKQLDLVRAADPEGGIVCLMSGNYVQRGTPAIFDKSVRAKAAIRCGADLVLELPVTAALRSAEGFASGGVEILSGFCNRLCFGAETSDSDALIRTAKALLLPDFPDALHEQLDKGLSFPSARQAALNAMGLNGSLLTQPNNILAIEYCKAILRSSSKMAPMPITRKGSYHDTDPDPENPSATSLRTLLNAGSNWQSFVPEEAAACYGSAAIHRLHVAEKAILFRLRTMTEEEYEALPYGSEGLWRKLMHAARSQATLEDILTATKSKRYTRSRLDRMVMCAFLGISQTMLDAPIPYTRVLSLNDRGREILKLARKTGDFPNTGQHMDHPYQQLETRCGSLYGLFTEGTAEPPDSEKQQRIFCL